MISWTNITLCIDRIIQSPSKDYIIVKVTDIYGRVIFRILHKSFGEDYKMVFTAGTLDKCLKWLREHGINIICNLI